MVRYLLIYILNNNEEITEEEKEILEKTKNKKRIIVVNKIDLKTKLNKKLLDSYIEISVKENIGIDNNNITIILLVLNELK